MSDAASGERRRYPRVARKWFVHFKRSDSAAEDWNVGKVKDLSAGGVRFGSDEVMEVKTRLDMKFNLVLPIDMIRGTIVRRQEVQPKRYEYAVAFEELRISDLETLKRIVDECLRKAHSK